ncbi:MAG: YihY/virulence factor BrkB family protein [Salegentibacter sp.]|uniref:Membrane protein n=1 Tax=Salegentibacter flavus TaxID=287099 RepID=A0A1I4Z573_9FLAO|nr:MULTISPECIES: YihY/virulence factor BrkB family protein [Salegentibacter]MDR9456189.1 YihY/virulence factor BrkB family protein [Salegentibacter sp.]SFN45412.1 membrane protein [Salegentibacter flavus]
MKFLKTLFSLLKKAYFSWNRNEPYARSATIAYYTLFSLPSLLIIVVTIASYFFKREDVQGRITDEIGEFIGQDSAQAIEAIVTNAALSGDSTWAIIFGIGLLLFGATGVFFQLKKAMNNIWNVAAKKSNFMQLILDRVISFGMVLVIGLLLLVSMVISAMLAILSDHIDQFAPGITGFMVDVINFLISFLIVTTLFAAVFKLLPDIKIRWRITYLGAALTTILFLIGEKLLGFYFGSSEPASVYGGASSVVLILLWVYYTCLILFYGAEFTVQYALYKNEKVVPNKYGEPAIYQEMEKLEQKRIQLEEEKEIIDTLQSNLEQKEERKNQDKKDSAEN